MSKHNAIESSIAFLMLLALLVSLSTNPVLVQVNDVAIANVTKSKSIIGQGFNMDICVAAANLGGLPETFNVTLNGTRTIVTTIKLNLYGSAIQGWGLTPSTISIPGPIISVSQGDLVNLALISQDGAPHQFYVDYNGDRAPSLGEPISPVFTGTINFQFTVSTLGTFTYYCSVHPLIMFGTFIVTAPPIILTEIGKHLVSLNAGASAVLVFGWNTTNFPKGNYTLTAIADMVPDETNTANNVLVDGFVTVAMIADVTGPTGWPDGKVDIRDLALGAKNYGRIDP